MLRERDLIARVRRTKKPETLPAVVEAATKAPFPRRLSKPPVFRVAYMKSMQTQHTRTARM